MSTMKVFLVGFRFIRALQVRCLKDEWVVNVASMGKPMNEVTLFFKE